LKRLSFYSILFILIISLLGIINLLNFDKPSVSELENRALKERPALSLENLLSGQYFRDFEEYYSDTFIMRDNFVRANRDINDAMSFLGPDVKIIASYEDLQTKQNNNEEKDNNNKNTVNDSKGNPDNKKDPDNKESSGNLIEPSNPNIPGTKETPSLTPEPEDELITDFDQQSLGFWMVVDGKVVQLFKFNKEGCEYYSHVLNKFRERLGSDVKIYSLIPPTNGEFMRLKKYEGITDSQNDALHFLKEKLDESITSVNIYDALYKHKDEYIYFRTDHHWTALGAYYAYESFMEARGEEPVALDKYEILDLGDFLGSSYQKTLDKSLEKNPDRLTAYKPFTDHEYIIYNNKKETRADVIDTKYARNITDKYLVFLSSGGANWSVIKTEVNNGKKILVVKDSFGNAFVPFLIPHFEEIYVIDSRFYNKDYSGTVDEFVKKNRINEVAFVIYMEDVNWEKFMKGVENLLGDTVP
jgi:hypothetical protein